MAAVVLLIFSCLDPWIGAVGNLGCIVRAVGISEGCCHIAGIL